MILAASSPNLLNFVIIGLVIIVIGAILRYLKQPYVIAYILVGAFLGKSGFQIITDESVITTMGEFGLILLLFFIGMEISLPKFIKNWRLPTIGTLFQIFASIAIIALVGLAFDWSVNRIVVLGFIISLSSSAVIIKLLQDNHENKTATGESVISILIMQDILIVPMLIVTSYLAGQALSIDSMILQLVGGLLVIGTIIYIIKKKSIKFPFESKLEQDHELQVFFAFIMCFGAAALSAFFGLSAALGAFVAGLLVHSSKATKWFHSSLYGFRVIFVALFFVSIGMLIDLSFLLNHWKLVSFILFMVFVINQLLNSLVLYSFKRRWRSSIYGGGLLAQIGELSFILISTALYSGIVNDFEYQLVIIVISLSLLISPLWISLIRYGILKYEERDEIKNKRP